MEVSSIMIIVLGGIVFLASFVSLIIMIILKIKNGRNKENKKIPDVDKSETDLIPINYYDLENNCYIMKDNSCMDFMKVNTKDINSASEDERTWDNMKFAKLYKTYGEDIKYITLNYPCHTKEQQEYWKHKIEITKNPIQVKLQKQRLFQLEWLEKHNTSREFYLMFFAKNIDEYHKNKQAILSVLATGRDGLLEEMAAEKKHQILYKIANKSSFIF